MLSFLSLLLTTKADFPNDVLGTWKGDLMVTPTGKETQKPVTMKLTIGMTEMRDIYTYTIEYEGQPARKYKLIRDAKEADHWQIDEGGGIVLDAYWSKDRLVTPFTVGKNTIVTTIRREGEGLVWETMTLNLSPAEADKAVGHRLVNMQTAYMKRIPAND